MLESLTESAPKSTIPITALDTKALSSWLRKQPARAQRWVKSTQFGALEGELCLIPGNDGKVARAIVGVSSLDDPWCYAQLPTKLPHARYRLDPAPEAAQANAAALGWALGTYRFSRYKKNDTAYASLSWPETADRGRISALIEAIGLCRDLINTQAE